MVFDIYSFPRAVLVCIRVTLSLNCPRGLGSLKHVEQFFWNERTQNLRILRGSCPKRGQFSWFCGGRSCFIFSFAANSCMHEASNESLLRAKCWILGHNAEQNRYVPALMEPTVYRETHTGWCHLVSEYLLSICYVPGTWKLGLQRKITLLPFGKRSY